MAQAIIQFVLVAGISVAVWMFVTLNKLLRKMKDMVLESSMLNSLIGLISGGWMQALFLYSAPWTVPAYAVL